MAGGWANGDGDRLDDADEAIGRSQSECESTKRGPRTKPGTAPAGGEERGLRGAVSGKRNSHHFHLPGNLSIDGFEKWRW